MIKEIKASELKVGDNLVNVGTSTYIRHTVKNIEVWIKGVRVIYEFANNETVYIHESEEK